ncbi:MAG: DNA polymerase III subunit chi [Rhodospirillaceae bacterium]|jgi:DNA polymerase III subunit chi|nr:DNA polymerase III subunit chi [Rhodospirillaceae bacterium]MBT5242438.1 DNA polymerase III subunit chi [Rhodospirillaceae bacterium]MBT5565254.1 DNA polymerase III subunit chi [Rhodospirillaceae bacterium]MBT6091112.1 DNA polymerase III subunit chi [Rhodospirillaceae bacterium]MBT7450991.1 DNA polymerase III subunit chi [Rhodospirillaceae bacterium]
MRVDFYHLQKWPLETALPQILSKVRQAGHRAVILAGSEERVESLSNALWTHDPNSWLANGTAKDGQAADHPIWLTDRAENPNQASVLVVTDSMAADDYATYDRCLDLFDGNDAEAVSAARDRWQKARGEGHELHYWQQTDRGGWEEKAQA